VSHRGTFEIKMDVLRIVQNEKKPTRIMYGANLSWKPTQRILRELAESDLIRAIDANRGERTLKDVRIRYIYELTPKGEKVLREYKHLNRTLEGALK